MERVFHAHELYDDVVNALKQYRAHYNYPKAYMVRTAPGTGDVNWPEGFSANHVLPLYGQITDTTLDEHHRTLLASEDPVDRAIGLASIIYWGFFTFSDNYARNRVRWHVHGCKGKAIGTTAHRAMAVTTLAHECMAAGNIGNAIASFKGVSQLGQTPFASKVLAFMTPEGAGIYDNHIQNGLAVIADANVMAGGVGLVQARGVRQRYSLWCDFLVQKTFEINVGIEISAGEQSIWSARYLLLSEGGQKRDG